MVDVVVRREDRDARRLEPDLDVLAWRSLVSVRSDEERRPRGRDDMRAGPDCSSGTLCLPNGPRDAEAVRRPSCVIVACGDAWTAVEREERDRLRAVLFER